MKGELPSRVAYPILDNNQKPNLTDLQHHNMQPEDHFRTKYYKEPEHHFGIEGVFHLTFVKKYYKVYNYLHHYIVMVPKLKW